MTAITTTPSKDKSFILKELIDLGLYPDNFNKALVNVMPETSVVIHAPGDLVTDTYPVFLLVDMDHGYLVRYDLRETILDYADYEDLETYEITEHLMEVEEIMSVNDVEKYVDFLINREVLTPELNELLVFLRTMKGQHP